MEKHEKEKKKLGLSTKIFIALLTGAVCGVLIHYYMPEGSMYWATVLSA